MASRDNPKEFIDNGLLFFLFNKVDYMNQDDLLNVCMDFYEEDAVSEACATLFLKYECDELQKEYRGSQKKSNNILQMMDLLRQKTPPPNITFCISRCTQIPPITIDHVDMATVLKLFSSLRSEVKLLSSSNKILRDRVSEIENRDRDHKKDETSDYGFDNASDEIIQQQFELLSQYKAAAAAKTREKDITAQYISKEKRKSSVPSTFNSINTRSTREKQEVKRDKSTRPHLGAVVNLDLRSPAENNDNSDTLSESSSSSVNEWQLQPWQRRKLRQYKKKENNEPTPATEIYRISEA